MISDAEEYFNYESSHSSDITEEYTMKLEQFEVIEELNDESSKSVSIFISNWFNILLELSYE